MSSEFAVLQLPREYVADESHPLVPKLAQKGRTLRLEALKTNPEAFGSTYEREIGLDDAHWRNRLNFANTRSLVAVDLRNAEHPVRPDATAAAADVLGIVSSAPWVGSTMLNGPRVFDGVFPGASGSAWALFNSAANGIASTDPCDWKEPKTLLYTMYAVYVSPEFRGKSIGKKLVEAAVKASEQDFAERKLKTANVRGVCVVFLVKGNRAAQSLYEGAGFEVMSEEDHTAPHGWQGVTVAFRKDIHVD